jgi:hypothetical protein
VADHPEAIRIAARIFAVNRILRFALLVETYPKPEGFDAEAAAMLAGYSAGAPLAERSPVG